MYHLYDSSWRFFCGIAGSQNYYLRSDSPCLTFNHQYGYLLRTHRGFVYGLRGYLDGEVDVGNNKKDVQELIVNVIIYLSASRGIAKGCDIK